MTLFQVRAPTYRSLVARRSTVIVSQNYFSRTMLCHMIPGAPRVERVVPNTLAVPQGFEETSSPAQRAGDVALHPCLF